jgi:hypothetical protein
MGKKYKKGSSCVLDSKEDVLKYLEKSFFDKKQIFSYKDFNVEEIKKGIYKGKFIIHFKAKKNNIITFTINFKTDCKGKC